MTTGKDRKLVVTDIDGERYIRVRDVLFIEADGSYCAIHYIDSSNTHQCVMASKNMAYYHRSSCSELLKIDRGVCVNPRYISSLTRERMVRFNIRGIAAKRVSRRRYADVRKALRQ